MWSKTSALPVRWPSRHERCSASSWAATKSRICARASSDAGAPAVAASIAATASASVPPVGAVAMVRWSVIWARYRRSGRDAGVSRLVEAPREILSLAVGQSSLQQVWYAACAVWWRIELSSPCWSEEGGQQAINATSQRGAENKQRTCTYLTGDESGRFRVPRDVSFASGRPENVSSSYCCTCPCRRCRDNKRTRVGSHAEREREYHIPCVLSALQRLERCPCHSC